VSYWKTSQHIAMALLIRVEKCGAEVFLGEDIIT
jgi:hypothetical protein